MKTERELNTGNVNMARRSFLRYAGAGIAGMGLMAASTSCHKDHHVQPSSGPISLGSGDTGILNYAYALEQLEAAFYTQVVATPYSGMSSVELTFLTEIRDHEVAHREFFKAALGSSAIQSLSVNFSKVDFTSRNSVLGTAKIFEDLGVSAYDGVAYRFQNVNYLAIAGSIVSVEARHAALIGNLLGEGFATNDQVSTTTGLNISNDPLTVLQSANAYLSTRTQLATTL